MSAPVCPPASHDVRGVARGAALTHGHPSHTSAQTSVRPAYEKGMPLTLTGRALARTACTTPHAHARPPAHSTALHRLREPAASASCTPRRTGAIVGLLAKADRHQLVLRQRQQRSERAVPPHPRRKHVGSPRRVGVRGDSRGVHRAAADEFQNSNVFRSRNGNQRNIRMFAIVIEEHGRNLAETTAGTRA